MTTDAAEESFKSQVETWLAAQMPIIQMHGGTSAVQKADPDTGEVVVELGGACSGCGVSDRTAHNIKLDLAQEFPEVEEVTVRVGGDGTEGWDLEQPESFMGVERLEGGRGGTMEREGSDADSHF
jgi:Fe-S cluster biogenesis protein NfuA